MSFIMMIIGSLTTGLPELWMKRTAGIIAIVTYAYSASKVYKDFSKRRSTKKLKGGKNDRRRN